MASELRYTKEGVPIYDGTAEQYVAYRRGCLELWRDSGVEKTFCSWPQTTSSSGRVCTGSCPTQGARVDQS